MVQDICLFVSLMSVDFYTFFRQSNLANWVNQAFVGIEASEKSLYLGKVDLFTPLVWPSPPAGHSYMILIWSLMRTFLKLIRSFAMKAYKLDPLQAIIMRSCYLSQYSKR